MESIKNSINNTCHRPVVVVHGGAWAIPDDKVEASLEGVRVAARAAWAVLSKGGRALDAVEAAVCALEDDPVFDAGTGAVLTSAGTVELDALIMEGMEHGGFYPRRLLSLTNIDKLSISFNRKVSGNRSCGLCAECKEPNSPC